MPRTLNGDDDDPHGLVGQHRQALLLAVDGQVEGDAVKVVAVGLGRPVERAVADGDGVGPGGGGLLGDGGAVGVGRLVQGQGGGVQVGRSADAEEQMGLDDPGRLGLVLGCLLVFQQGRLHHGLVSESLGQQPPDGLVGAIVVLLQNNVRSVFADRSNILDAARLFLLLRCRRCRCRRLILLGSIIIVLHHRGEGRHLPPVAVQVDRHHRQAGHAPHAAQGQVLALVDDVGRQRRERSRRRHAGGRTGVGVVLLVGVGGRVRRQGARAAVRGDAGRHGHAAPSEAGSASSGRCEAHGRLVGWWVGGLGVEGTHEKWIRRRAGLSPTANDTWRLMKSAGSASSSRKPPQSFVPR